MKLSWFTVGKDSKAIDPFIPSHRCYNVGTNIPLVYMEMRREKLWYVKVKKNPLQFRRWQKDSHVSSLRCLPQSNLWLFIYFQHFSIEGIKVNDNSSLNIYHLLLLFVQPLHPFLFDFFECRKKFGKFERNLLHVAMR